ncbi:IPT/TIG domain-containing protein [Dysgonomonas sp. 520]|uniref:IPT/TIG domain-containing protein n=1 Tax=Dysgonomonas sp. 520 TaxID=2302931 RepID=UPI0013D47481|nr:IPT/TIG domain-containing protein [Dysgonomonas sp. 520]
MKNISYKLAIFLSVILSFTLVACDEDGQIDTSDIRGSVVEPAITSFEPLSGAPGTEIMIAGVNFATVDTVYIGGELATIKNRISNTKILIEVSPEARSGKIQVKNPKGIAESSSDFTVEVVVPTLAGVRPSVEGKMTIGETVIMKGTDLKSVMNVYVGDVAAKISYVTNDSLGFIVPQLTVGASVKVAIGYLDGASEVVVSDTENFVIAKPTAVPVVSEFPTSATIGETITITGTNMDSGTRILLGDEAINFESQTPTEVTFTIPTSYYAETKVDMILVYNETEQMTVVSNFVINVPSISNEVTFYPGLEIHAQDPAMTNQFFNVEKGIFYSACEYAANKNNISFFITWSDSNGTFQINNPSNSANQTSMFMCGETLLPGEKLPTVLKFRLMRPTNKNEGPFYTQVKNRTLGKISPEIISEAKIQNATLNTPRFNYNNINPSNPFSEGDVLMFQKFDSSGATVQKVGFIEIVKVDVPDDIKRQTTMTFNCWFQKD